MHDRTELRRLAEAARERPWDIENRGPTYVQRFSPVTVLALLDIADQAIELLRDHPARVGWTERRDAFLAEVDR